MKIIQYLPEHADLWDRFVEESAQGTFLHSRKFLGYHENRFADVSVLIFNEKDQLRGVFPAAKAADDQRSLISHPGSTYGGVIHRPEARADEVCSMLTELSAWYRQQDYNALIYKSVPLHIQKPCIQSDQYALWQTGAKLVRRDLWNVLDLTLPRKLSKGHRWGLQKARKAGVVISENGQQDTNAFHALLSECLDVRHHTLPVHTAAELLELQNRFPEHIQLWGGYESTGSIIAGVWLFKLSETCWHTQYIAASEHGRMLFASDLLLETLVQRALEKGVRYFSFGASTENQGTTLNSGLFSFKAGFGSGAVVHDFYQLNLTR